MTRAPGWRRALTASLVPLSTMACSSDEPLAPSAGSERDVARADSTPGGTPLEAALSSADEVPPAAGEASGTATLTLNSGQGVLCYELSLQNAGPVTGGHVHAGTAGLNGPVLIDLNLTGDGGEGCVERSVGTLLSASAPAAGDGFGRALAVDGDTLIVGANAAAYVFVQRGGTWHEEQRLTGAAPDFGASVSLSGDTALVGADEAAFVFVRRGDFRLQQKLTPTAAEEDFGVAVAVSGDTALVGAPADVLEGDVGSVYVFERRGSSWTEETRLRAGVGGGSCFGCAVALAGNTALVGDPQVPSAGQGRLFGFERSDSAWTGTGPGGYITTGSQLGTALAVDEDTALVGAPFFWVSQGGEEAIAFGAAQVHGRAESGWTLQDFALATVPRDFARYPDFLLTASDLPGFFQGYPAFSASVALHGDVALIGAPTEGGEPAAYLFTRSATLWKELKKLMPTAGQPSIGFAETVALSSTDALIGAPGDDTAAGAVFVHRSECIRPEQSFTGCVTAERELLKTIRQKPECYYVNVHTEAFPEGAARGQLARP